VNDGSTDGTGALLDAAAGGAAAAGEVAALSTLHLPRNAGKAAAVRAGVQHALEKFPDADYVGFWDADLATPLEELSRFIAALDAGKYEAVTGLRLSRLGSHVSRRPLRHYLGRAFATVVSLMLGIPVYDTQCGAKLFRAGVARELFAEPFITRWFFDVELFARHTALHGGGAGGRAATTERVREQPLETWHDIEGSRLKLRDFFLSPIALAKIFFHYR